MLAAGADGAAGFLGGAAGSPRPEPPALDASVAGTAGRLRDRLAVVAVDAAAQGLEQECRRRAGSDQICASGSITGSSQRPCDYNGRFEGLAVGAAETSVATPFRSRSRGGIEASPSSASCTVGPRRSTFSTVALPLAIFTCTLSVSKGVRPLRNSLPPEQRAPLQPPQQLLDIQAGKRALGCGQAAFAIECAGKRINAWPVPSSRKGQAAFGIDALDAEDFADTALEADIVEMDLRGEGRALFGLGEIDAAADHAAEARASPMVMPSLPDAQIGGDRGAAKFRRAPW